MRQTLDTTVVVLGAGPAGLLAAHAVELSGGHAVLIDRRVEKPAAQPGVYLHRAIPEVHGLDPDASVQFVFKGTRDGYALKTTGRTDAPCSWDEYRDRLVREGWSLDTVIDKLWERYGERVAPDDIGPRQVRSMVGEFGLVISTIPAHHVCERQLTHRFDRRSTWITTGIPDGEWLPGENSYVYNGRAEDAWIRCGRVFGHTWTEWPARSDIAGAPGTRHAVRPIDTNCDCFPDVLRVGRFGTWTRGVLLSDAFDRTWNYMFDHYEGST